MARIRGISRSLLLMFTLIMISFSALTIQAQANESPKIITKDVKQAFEDTQYLVNYQAEDNDTDAVLTWKLQTNAIWLSMDATSGTLKGTPGNDNIGTFQVVITVTDEHGSTDKHTFSIIVNNTNDPPKIESITSPQEGATFLEGTNISFGVKASDVDLIWGDKLAFVWEDNVIGPIANTQSGGAVLPPGHHTLTVTVLDREGAKDVRTINLTVNAKHKPAPLSGPGSSALVQSWFIGLAVAILIVVISVSATVRLRKARQKQVTAQSPAGAPVGDTKTLAKRPMTFRTVAFNGGMLALFMIALLLTVSCASSSAFLYLIGPQNTSGSTGAGVVEFIVKETTKQPLTIKLSHTFTIKVNYPVGYNVIGNDTVYYTLVIRDSTGTEVEQDIGHISIPFVINARLSDTSYVATIDKKYELAPGKYTIQVTATERINYEVTQENVYEGTAIGLAVLAVMGMLIMGIWVRVAIGKVDESKSVKKLTFESPPSSGYGTTPNYGQSQGTSYAYGPPSMQSTNIDNRQGSQYAAVICDNCMKPIKSAPVNGIIVCESCGYQMRLF